MTVLSRSKALVVMVLVACAGAFVPRSQGQPSQPTTGIGDKVFVKSNDTELFVEVRSLRKNAPVILCLHDGPANPMGIFAIQAYAGQELEKDFIVAYLHQRGVVSSPDVPDSTQTVAHHVEDVDHVVDYLRTRFKRDGVSLIGHSWGGLLGYLYLLEHQDKIEKLVAVAAPFNVAASDLASYEMTLQWARDTNNDGAIKSLQAIGSPPHTSYQAHVFKSFWSAEAFGSLARNVSWDEMLEKCGVTSYEQAWGDEQSRIGEAMYAEFRSLNVEDDVRKLATPLLLIAGRNDAEVPYFELKKGFENYGGPKRFVIFDNSHHLPFVDETERFVNEVRAFLVER